MTEHFDWFCQCMYMLKLLTQTMLANAKNFSLSKTRNLNFTLLTHVCFPDRGAHWKSYVSGIQCWVPLSVKFTEAFTSPLCELWSQHSELVRLWQILTVPEYRIIKCMCKSYDCSYGNYRLLVDQRQAAINTYLCSISSKWFIWWYKLSHCSLNSIFIGNKPVMAEFLKSPC